MLFVALRWVEQRGLRERLHRLSEERKFALELRISLLILCGLAALAVNRHVSIMLAGFSFGAATGLKACCPDPRVVGLIALGTPLSVQERLYTYSYLSTCTKPKLMVSGDHDQFAPAANLREIFKLASEPKEFVLVEDADHFFEGKLPIMRGAITEWLPRHFPALNLQQRV